MISNSEELKLLYKIACSYYEDGLTQEAIAHRLGLSRIKVSRLLRRARQDRIVQITVVNPTNGYADLERALEAAYGLDEAVIVSPVDYEGTELLRALGRAGAATLIRGLEGSEIVALSWGTTLLAVVDALPMESWPDMRVVQMIGGLGRPEAEVHGADLARRMAQMLGARLRLLSAPGIVKTKLVRDSLLDDPHIADTLQLATKANVALVGIGVPSTQSAVMRAGTILSTSEIRELQALGAVGDIALRFFNADGLPVPHEINNRIIGLELAQIKRIRRVIGVAGGLDKLEVIRGALCGKLINVLVTDDRTAMRLLESHPRGQMADTK